MLSPQFLTILRAIGGCGLNQPWLFPGRDDGQAGRRGDPTGRVP